MVVNGEKESELKQEVLVKVETRSERAGVCYFTESNRTRFQKLISQYRDVQICSEKQKEMRLSQEEKAIKTTRDRTSHWQSTQAPVY